MSNLIVNGNGVKVSLPYLDLAFNWELVFIILSLYLLARVARSLRGWNWSRRARSIGAGLKVAAVIVAAWVSIWLLVAGQFPPNPFIIN